MNKTFLILIQLLNKYHNTNYKKKNWEILIKRWYIFIYKYLENNLKKNKKKKNIKIFARNNNKSISNNSFYYLRNYESIFFCEVLKENYSKFFNKKVKIFKNKTSINIKNDYIKNLLKKIYIGFLFFFLKFSKKKTIITSTGFSKYEDIKLNFEINKLPYFIPEMNDLIINFNDKKNYMLDIDQKRIFLLENLHRLNLSNKTLFILSFIIKTMPKSFLENYKIIKNSFYYKIFDKNKKILTRYGLFSNDILKIWIMNNLSQIKIYQIQHGMDSSFKINKKFADDYEGALANKFFVWSKNPSNQLKNMPLGIQKIKKSKNKIIKKIKEKKITLLLKQFFPETIDLDINYILSRHLPLREIVNNFKKKYNNNFFIKFHSDDLNYISHLMKFFEIEKKNVCFDDFNNIFESSDIIIFNYFSSGFYLSYAHKKKCFCIYKFSKKQFNLYNFRQKKIINSMIDQGLIVSPSKFLNKFKKNSFETITINNKIFNSFENNFAYVNLKYFDHLISELH